MRKFFFLLLFPLLFLAISTVKLIPVPDVRQVSGALGMKGKGLGELDAKTEFKQSFVPHQNTITGIAINFGNYLRANSGTVSLILSTLNLKDSANEHKLISEKELAVVKVAASKLREKDYVFWLPAKKISPNKPLLITLFSTSPREKAVTVWASRKDRYKEGLLFVNGSPIDGDIVFQTYYFESLADIFVHILEGKGPYRQLINPYAILVASMILFSLIGLAINRIMLHRQF